MIEQRKIIDAKKSKIVAVYCDGGIVGVNPSPIGGTWAWCGVDDHGERIIDQSGIIRSVAGLMVTNNIAEQYAMVMALEYFPDGWAGTVYSDSYVAITRLKGKGTHKNLPASLIARTRAVIKRLGNVKYVLIQGHPTKEQLARGWGKNINTLVSIHNVYVDQACNEAKKLFEK